jgi:KDO2-lipid IV(A) lauroyltransferase
VEYLLLKLLSNVLTPLSRDKLFRFSEVLGKLVYRFPRVKNVSEENLEFCNFSKAFGREAVVNLLKCFLDFMKSRDYSEDYLKSLFSVKEGKLKRVLSMDGAILLTAHIGNWELLGAFFSVISGGRLSVVAKPMKNPRVNEFINGLREFWRMKVIPTGKVLEVVKDLKRGRFVAILLDQRPKVKEGVLTDFLGRKTYTNKGAALLSLKTGKPVIPAFCYLSGSKYEVEIFDPIYPDGKSVEELTQIYTSFIERAVMKHPEQWFWVHRRWKNSPEFKRWKSK